MKELNKMKIPSKRPAPNPEAYDCADCGVNTLEIEEYYVIKDNLWKEILEKDPQLSEEDRRKQGISTMLCIGCVEDRLGRKLNQDDFKEIRINQINGEEEAHRTYDPEQRAQLEEMIENWLATLPTEKLSIHEQHLVEGYHLAKKEGTIIPLWRIGIYNKSERLRKRLGFENNG